MTKRPEDLVEVHMAREHDIIGSLEVPPLSAEDAAATHQAVEHTVTGAYKKVEDTVVGAYKKVEGTVVGTYKKVEGSVVGAYRKVEDAVVGKIFARPGESLEDAKKRLSAESKK